MSIIYSLEKRYTVVSELIQGPPAIILPIATILLVGRPQDMVPAIGYLRPGYLIMLILVACIIRWRDRAKEVSIFNIREVILVYTFIFMMYISVLYADFKGSSFYFLIQFTVVPIYFYCLCKFANTRKDFIYQLWSINIAILCISLFAIVKKDLVTRVHVGTMYDPNDLALIIVSNIPIAWFLLIIEKNIFKKIILVILILLSLYTLIITISRGASLALISIIFVGLCSRLSNSIGRFAVKKIIAMLLLMVSFVSFAPDRYWERMRTIYEGEDQGSGRLILWLRGLEMIADHPIFGYGVKNFNSVYGNKLKKEGFENQYPKDRWSPNAWTTAHNSFLQVAVELGILGLFVFIGIFVTCIISIRKVQRWAVLRKDDFMFSAAAYLRLSFIAFVVAASFLSFAYQTYLFYLISISVVIGKIVKVQDVNVIEADNDISIGTK